MVFYRRRLPHWQPADKSFFITWRLHGSLPQASRRSHHAESVTPSFHGDEHYPDDTFFNFDRQLDDALSGPVWLRDPKLAEMVVNALQYGENTLGLYSLWSYVVMPNHVHVLITPRVALEKITRAIKGYTAREANQGLNRAGQKFWQAESFDHWIRSEGSFNRIVQYIENNPVQAGLAAKPEEWPWSSAARSKC